MAETPLIIAAILKGKKITDVLESRGIFPERESPGRLAYLCPIHEGDSIPSFMVFTDGEYQTYKCFGCHSGSDVINLLSALDNVSLRKSIHTLAEGVDIVQDEITDAIIDNIIEGKLEDSKELEKSMLESGSFCREHLSRWNDDAEKEFFVHAYEVMDRIIRSNDVDGVKQVYKILCEKGIPLRTRLCLERKENKILNEVRVWKK